MTSPFENISAETLDKIQKAAQSGINISSGIFGFDLGDIVSLVPVNTPIFDRFGSVTAPQGSDAATWRAILNVNNIQPDPMVGRDAGGNFVQISEHDVATKYQPVRLSGKVTQDAIDFARNYADAKSISTFQTMMQWKIATDKILLAGQACALPTIGTVTCTAATTGGTIASGTTLYVKAAAKSMRNYFWGGGGIASASANAAVGTTTSTNKVTATLTAIRGAVAYDWWTSTDNATWYYTTTTTAPVAVFTKTLSAGAAVPTTAGPELYGTAPSNTPYAADTSFTTKDFNGLLSTLSSDYSAAGPLVTYGSGDLASGATFTDLGGAGLTGTAQAITELDNLNAAVYAASQLSPTAYIASPQEAQSIANKTLGTNQAVTYIGTGDSRVGLTIGGQVTHYINRITGDKVEIITEPRMPYGTLLAITESVPYPNSNIGRVFERRCLRDVSQFDYGVSLTAGGAGSGPRQEYDISAICALVNRAPVACAALTGIGAS